MARTRIVVHGHSVTAEFVGGVGGGPLLMVGGVPWSDVVGLRRGWGTTFRGKSHTDNWFHFSIPTPQVLQGTLLRRVQQIFVNLEVAGQVEARSFHLWDGHRNRIFARDGLHVTGEFGLDTSSHTMISSLAVVGISIGVHFEQEAEITFLQAAAEFEIS
jgi:hypothetical protein